MNFFRIVVVLSILSLISSCALIFKGDSSRVVFTSNPSQATVLVDGVNIGTTTTATTLKTDKSYMITFQKAGFANRTFVLTNHIGALWIVLDVLSGLVPLVIDAATGAWYEFDTTTVNVDLNNTLLEHKPLPDWARKAVAQQRFQVIANQP